MNKKKISKERAFGFLWQQTLLLISLFIMTFGVALCIRSGLGSSVISSLPMSFSLAGELGKTMSLTIGGYTNIMNIILVALQVIILRKKFQPVQLFQLIIGWVFGWMIDVNMALTSLISYDSIWMRIAAQFVGCTVMALGISSEIRCGSVTMPGEGIQVAISRVTGKPFGIVKIVVDTTLVVLAVVSSYCFFGTWLWSIIGPGTLFAMIYVGWLVKSVSPHMSWFDKLLNRPGFRRYIVGLARFIYPRGKF